MHSEEITWHEVAEEMPDTDITVLISNDAWTSPVDMGWWDSEHYLWRDISAATLTGGVSSPEPPTRWAHLPAGTPAKEECKAEKPLGEVIDAVLAIVWPWTKGRRYDARVTKKGLKHGRVRLQLTAIVEPKQQ